jgi:hypothetical protein
MAELLPSGELAAPATHVSLRNGTGTILLYAGGIQSR